LAPQQKNDFGALFNRKFERKITSAKMEKYLLKNHHRNLDEAPPNTIYGSQLQKTLVLRAQPQQQGMLTQPFHVNCDPRSPNTLSQRSRSDH
jgi:hypothetical protein